METMKATESKSTVLLHHHLKVLRLPTVAAECEKVAAQAAALRRGANRRRFQMRGGTRPDRCC